jgi:alpha-glucoside transport system substrate-binding protein
VTRPNQRRLREVTTAMALVLISLVALASCGSSGSAGSVSVTAVWTGAEGKAFEQVLARFEQTTGITVNYTGDPEVSATLADAVAKGDPPDVAVLSDPASFQNYVSQHRLKPLNGVLDAAQMQEQYPSSWRSLMQAGTHTYYAVVVKASLKSLIWYDPAVFQAHGYTVPATWDQLAALTHKAAGSGGSPAPWCLGLESPAASGWPGTDWIEDILLHQSGPAVYQNWADGQLSWTSAPVVAAWKHWGQLIGGQGAIDGSARSALITDDANAGSGLFATRPGCLMDHEASFAMANYSSTLTGNHRDAQPGTDFDLAEFPQIQPKYANSLEVAADLAGMFRDTPQARRLLAFLASPAAQEVWTHRAGSGVLSVNTAVPLSVYRDRTSTAMARMITGQAFSGRRSTVPLTLSFDASDLMPAPMRTAFYQGVLQYVADPGQLSSILAGLDRIRTDPAG